MALVHREIEYYMVDSAQPKRVRAERLHDRVTGLNGSLIINVELMQEPFPSPLFVGTGNYEVDDHGLYQPFARRGKQLVIPGAGIKGAVRAHTEALSPSCEGGTCKDDSLCPCCQIFGTLGVRGKVSFCDAGPVNVERLVLAKPAILLRRGGRRDNGRRFYWHSNYLMWGPQPNLESERVEVVKPPATFTCECFLRDMTEEEMGLLLLGMGMAPRREFRLKLGGGKNRGLGSVWFKLKDNLIRLIPEGCYGEYRSVAKDVSLTEWGNRNVEKYLANLPDRYRQTVDENIGHFGFVEKDITMELIKQEFEEGRRRHMPLRRESESSQ